MCDVRAGGSELRLSVEKLAELAAIVEARPDREKDGVSRWRRVDLQLVIKARLDKVTSHSGRRTFITGLAHKGVNVRVLAALAGHRNIATTQRYIELNDHVLRAAVELV